MPQHAGQQCFHCRRLGPDDILMPSEMPGAALQETMKKNAPSLAPGGILSVDSIRLEKKCGGRGLL